MNRLATVVNGDDWVVLDTETTGLDASAQVIQIGILDSQGNILVDTLVRPTCAIPPEATRIHGLTDADVATAPTIMEALPQVAEAICGRHVIVYNAEFDVRMLQQTTDVHNLDVDWAELPLGWLCAMKAYAEHKGDRNTRYGGYRWHNLANACCQQHIVVKNAHSAIGDCRMTLALVRKICGN